MSTTPFVLGFKILFERLPRPSSARENRISPTITRRQSLRNFFSLGVLGGENELFCGRKANPSRSDSDGEGERAKT